MTVDIKSLELVGKPGEESILEMVCETTTRVVIGGKLLARIFRNLPETEKAMFFNELGEGNHELLSALFDSLLESDNLEENGLDALRILAQEVKLRSDDVIDCDREAE